MYGNVLLDRDGDGKSQIVHYGEDSGTLSHYRQGTLWFFQNTVVSRRSGNTTLFRLSSSAEAADARNNIVSVTATGNRLGKLDQTGTLTIARNWFKTGWVNSHSGAAGVINNGQITGSDPGFQDAAFDNFELASTSAAIDQGIPAAPATLPEHAIVRQYMKHQGSRTRPISGPIDLGAYEFSLPSAVPPAETQSPARLLAWHTPSPGPFAFELSEAPPTASPAEIFDVLGRRVARVEKGEADGRWTWRPTVDLSPGVYVARIGALTTRVVLVR